MDTKFTIEWNSKDIANAFQITENDVHLYFTDGRRVSFLIERRLVQDNPGWNLAPSEGSGYDLVAPNGGKWEVRSVGNKGVYFCPSYMVGKNRKFEEAGFLKKLEELEGYILSDIMCFPSVPVLKVDKNVVKRWYFDKKLGKTSRISRSVYNKQFYPSIN